MNSLSTRSFTAIIAIGVGVFGLTLLAINQGWFSKDRKVVDEPDEVVRPTEIPEGYELSGGVVRPISDTKRLRDKRSKEKPKGYHPGSSPPVKKDANENAKSIYAARGIPELQHRFTSMKPAPKFDLKAYKENPKAYLDVVEPARVNQSLPPGKDVKPIRRVGKYIFDGVLQGESVKLKAKVDPNMPITFSSKRLGSFENGLTSITVAANDQGIAEVDFKLTAGTLGSIDVKAASPVHSDAARWLINVVRPLKKSSK